MSMKHYKGTDRPFSKSNRQDKKVINACTLNLSWSRSAYFSSKTGQPAPLKLTNCHVRVLFGIRWHDLLFVAHTFNPNPCCCEWERWWRLWVFKRAPSFLSTSLMSPLHALAMRPDVLDVTSLLMLFQSPGVSPLNPEPLVYPFSSSGGSFDSLMLGLVYWCP